MPSKEPVPWLDRDQSRAWIALVSTLAWLPGALDEQLGRDAGMTFVEYSVLAWLSMKPSRSGRMSEIAELANVQPSHLSRIAARLETRGWLARTPDPSDGRATIATLTDEGWDRVVAAAPGHVEEVQRLVFHGLSGRQVAQLADICESIVHATRPGHCLPNA